MIKLTRMIAVGALTVAMLAGAAPASHADCVSAEVYTESNSGNKNYIIGPKRCVVGTPFPEGGSFDTGTTIVPVGAKVWFVVPI